MSSVIHPRPWRLSRIQLKQRLRAVRHQQAKKARTARRQLERIHQQQPKKVRAVFDPLELAFSRPTHRRFVLLALAAILTLGGRTVAKLLRVVGCLAPGHPTSFHRVFSRNRWASSPLARRYVAAVLSRFAPRGRNLLAGDDTVTEHPGPHVYGKARHRDPVWSTHSYTAFRWGHKWVVLALLVPVPWATRRWALPLLVTLYRSQEENQKQARRHKTPPQLLGQMLRLLIRWFPDRTFVATADANYATHELAELAARVPRRLTLVSKFYPNAKLRQPRPWPLRRTYGPRRAAPAGRRRRDHPADLVPSGAKTGPLSASKGSTIQRHKEKKYPGNVSHHFGPVRQATTRQFGSESARIGTSSRRGIIEHPPPQLARTVPHMSRDPG